jgi:hypothetical protein
MYDHPGPAADDAELVVSELVGNCVRADAHHFDHALDGHHDRLRVEATDDAPGQPSPRPASPTAEGGRGLLIVDNLATNWGVRADAPAKTVWADIDIATDSDPTFGCAHSQ